MAWGLSVASGAFKLIQGSDPIEAQNIGTENTSLSLTLQSMMANNTTMVELIKAGLEDYKRSAS